MHKTPDDIKNGLYWCSKPVETMDCEQCPYYRTKGCADNLCSDVAKLVQQLEADLEDMTARYKIADDCAKKKGEMNEKLYAELAAVKAERDAAVKAIEAHRSCRDCIHSKITHSKAGDVINCPKWDGSCLGLNMWQWRGVQT